MDVITRQPRDGEVPALRSIWRTVFGADDEVFFGFYFEPRMSVAAIAGSVPVAAGYLLPAGNILAGGASVPCAMIYAVATLPEHRSRGFGAAVVRRLVSLGRDSGYPAIVLCPSGDSLFEYYSARSGLVEWFYVDERTLGGPSKGAGMAELKEIGPSEYGQIREALLGPLPHIESDPRILEYQSILCNAYGGGLYKAESAGGVSCAVVETGRDGAVWIKELLSPDGCEGDALAALASAYPAKRYVVRTPAAAAPSTPVSEAIPQSMPQSTSQSMPQPMSQSTSQSTSQSMSQSTSQSTPQSMSPDARCSAPLPLPGKTVRRFGMAAAPNGLLPSVSPGTAAPWYGLAFD